jgi:Tat protein translocase TatB subunit
MGDISFGEMLVFFVITVVVFGPKKIPEVARGLGTAVRQLKSAVEGIKQEILKEDDNPLSDIKKELGEVKNSLNDLNPLNDLKQEINQATEGIDTSSVKINPLNDAHQGPVSR